MNAVTASKQGDTAMDISITVNLWFLVSLCLVSLLLGGLLFGGRSSGGNRYR
jgi:hypothetical protein